jgi:hypothetical protein
MVKLEPESSSHDVDVSQKGADDETTEADPLRDVESVSGSACGECGKWFSKARDLNRQALSTRAATEGNGGRGIAICCWRRVHWTRGDRRRNCSPPSLTLMSRPSPEPRSETTTVFVKCS